MTKVKREKSVAVFTDFQLESFPFESYEQWLSAAQIKQDHRKFPVNCKTVVYGIKLDL